MRGLVPFLLCVACGASAPALVPAPPSRCWLVWARTAHETVTRTVCEGAAPSAVEPGAFVVVEGERRELVVREERARRWRCVWEGAPPAEQESSDPGDEVVGRTLELVGTSRTTLLPLPDLDMQTEVVDEIEVLASLGPYLAVRRDLWQQGVCAAHLYGRTDYVWLDLRTGEAVDAGASCPADRAEAARALLPLVQAELAPEEYGVPPIWAEERRVMVEGGLQTEAEADALLTARVEALLPARLEARFNEAAEVPGLAPFWDGAVVRGRHHATYWHGDCCRPLEAFLPPVALPEPLAEWAAPPPEVVALVTDDVVAFGYSELPAS